MSPLNNTKMFTCPEAKAVEGIKPALMSAAKEEKKLSMQEDEKEQRRVK